MITKTAIRIFENKEKSLSTYGKPIIAIPLNAVSKVERTSFDLNSDDRMHGINKQNALLNKNLLEIILKDEFLPIYTHQQYTKMFNDASVAFEVSQMSPNKKRSSTVLKSTNGSPYRGSNVSK